MRKRVVLVEDDDVIRENYAELLTDEGFEVEAFGDRHVALTHVEESAPDIVLLDITLNEERDAGFQLCADLRRFSCELPIIFLTCHDREIDKISGIRLGADDYLTKDVSLDYLVVRIEALLRRMEALTIGKPSKGCDKAGKLTRGPLTIEKDLLTLFWRDQKPQLTVTQFWITHELATSPGQVKSYNKLMRTANIHVEPNTITAHIKTIRESFKAIDDDFDCIKTVRGSGYRWLDT